MTRHVLTLEERKLGLRTAIASRKTPKHLKKHLRSALENLESGRPPRKSTERPKGFLGFFEI